MKKRFKKIVLAASLAAFGCNCGIVNTVGLLEGTKSDLFGVLFFGIGAKALSDNLDLYEKTKFHFYKWLKQVPPELAGVKVSERLFKICKECVDFYNEHKKENETNITLPEGDGLTFKEVCAYAYKIKNEQFSKALKKEVVLKMKKDRFFNLSIGNGPEVEIPNPKEKKGENKQPANNMNNEQNH